MRALQYLICVIWAFGGVPVCTGTIHADSMMSGRAVARDLQGTFRPGDYNYTRDYEPGTGRYLESDPNGLIGGVSTYSYVENDPLNGLDPLGLWKIYGMWCGPNWTGGFKKSWNDLTQYEQEHVKPAMTPLDKLCEGHDKCWGNCGSKNLCSMQARSKCLMDCNSTLVNGGKKLGFWGNLVAAGIAIDKPGLNHPEDASPPYNPLVCPCGNVD
jgi:RHS repeat-associated protein